MQAVPPAQDQLRVAAEEEKGLPDPPASVGAARQSEKKDASRERMRESIGQKAVLPSPLAVLGLCCRRSRGAARCVS